ncbi:MAG: HEAT repeat domain-containing protein [Acidimicrobiales bacterium]
MRENDLVQLLAVPDQRAHAIRELVGGVGATELRQARPSYEAMQALIDGLRDESPQVRWWCVQLIDHVPDDRALDALVPVLDDPVPRVRRNAAHALGCVPCKPTWNGRLGAPVMVKLAEMAARDVNAKVRQEARRSLACAIS